jgi:hypothetical protein
MVSTFQKKMLSISIRVEEERFVEKKELLESLANFFWPQVKVEFTVILQESKNPYITTEENPLINMRYLKFDIDPDAFLEIIGRGEKIGNQAAIL